MCWCGGFIMFMTESSCDHLWIFCAGDLTKQCWIYHFISSIIGRTLQLTQFVDACKSIYLKNTKQAKKKTRKFLPLIQLTVEQRQLRPYANQENLNLQIIWFRQAAMTLKVMYYIDGPVFPHSWQRSILDGSILKGPLAKRYIFTGLVYCNFEMNLLVILMECTFSSHCGAPIRAHCTPFGWNTLRRWAQFRGQAGMSRGRSVCGVHGALITHSSHTLQIPFQLPGSLTPRHRHQRAWSHFWQM